MTYETSVNRLPKWILIVALLFVCLCSAFIPLNGSGIVQRAYNIVQEEGISLAGRTTIDCTGTGITCSDAGGKTVFNVPGASATQQHSITFVIDGGGTAILAGDLNAFPTAAYSCTINRADISADQSGSIEVDIWLESGAIPTAADLISGATPVELSGAQLAQNVSLAGWSLAVVSGDVFGASVASAMTVERVTVQIWCE